MNKIEKISTIKYKEMLFESVRESNGLKMYFRVTTRSYGIVLDSNDNVVYEFQASKGEQLIDLTEENK